MLMNAAIQFWLIADDFGVVGHWASCRLEPANPPMRVLQIYQYGI